MSMRTLHITRLLNKNTVYSIIENGQPIYTSYTPYPLLDSPQTLLLTERDRNWLPEYVMFKLIKHMDKLSILIHDDLSARHILKRGLYKVPKYEQIRLKNKELSRS